MVIVQESYEGTIGRTLESLKQTLFSSSVLAATLIAFVKPAV